ncbi:hypothetical protein C0Q16_29255, partial [Klebsiella pneumoniae]
QRRLARRISLPSADFHRFEPMNNERSNDFAVLAQRPVNQDGLIGEWPEEGPTTLGPAYFATVCGFSPF